MRVAYIRVSKGLPTEQAQRDALLAAGLTPEEIAEAYLDRQRKPRPGEAAQPQRDYIVGAVREGDELWVARAGVIATTADDALAFVAQVCDQGAVLRIASTGETYNCPSAVASQIADGLRLAAAIREDERKAVMERARRGLKGKPAGKPKASASKLEAARLLWADPAVTAEDAAKRTGLGVRTLYRYFGAKGTPAFGRAAPRKTRR